MPQKQLANSSTSKRFAAFSVHLITASGALWALLGFVAAANEQWMVMFAWLGVAFIVDGIDGPLARILDVTNRLPHWSGSSLDVVIDYTTYVLLPAFAVAQGPILDHPYNLVFSGMIAVTGALYYALRETKTADNHFKGFPVVWNMLIFDVFVFDFSEVSTIFFVLFFCILTFVPINFVHPVRVQRWKYLTLAMTIIWLCSAIMSGVNDMSAMGSIAVIHTISGIYLLVIGGVFQFFDFFRGENSPGD